MGFSKSASIALIAAAVIALAVVYLVPQASVTGYAVTKAPDKIRIAYLTITSALPLFVGIERGYFSEAGLDVAPVKFESSNIILDALAADKVDATVTTASTTSLVVEEKSPGLYKVFGINANGIERNLDVLLVPINSSIQKPNELRGKRVGTFPGTLAVIMLKRYLREEGIPSNEVEVVQLEPKLHLQALQSGSIDALLTYEPTGTIAVQKGAARVLVKAPFAQKILNPWPGGFFTVSTKYLKDHKIQSKRLVAAFEKSADYIRSNENEVRKLLVKYAPISEEIALKVPLTTYWKRTEINTTQLQRFADIFLEEGALTKRIDVTRVLLSEQDLG